MPFPIKVVEEVDGRAVSVAYDLAARAPIPRARDEDAVRLARRWGLRRVVDVRRAFSIACLLESRTESRGVGGWESPKCVGCEFAAAVIGRRSSVISSA